ncbi:MAG: ribonuclease PH [Magnetococcus sp. DMHC-6]
MTRLDGRKADALRPILIQRSFLPQAEGSCLITCGHTRVICTATIEERLPNWMRDQNRGWVTAEYGMLPRATNSRTTREASQGRQGGRTLEIQRLIGRSLRAVTHLDQLGKRTIWIDCDVIEADGGTRTAAITGGFVALMDACRSLVNRNLLPALPIKQFVAAVSCGMVNGQPCLDLNYQEDSTSDTDMNFVMTEQGEFIEIQGTAEGMPFSRNDLQTMTTLAEEGIQQLIAIQRLALDNE